LIAAVREDAPPTTAGAQARRDANNTSQGFARWACADKFQSLYTN